MNKNAGKLLISGLVLLICLVMIAGASVAWYSVSTHPEISGANGTALVEIYASQALLVSGSENGTYGSTMDLGGVFSRYVELRPVSTTDGVNWFLPTYTKLGPINDPSEFILDNTLQYANVLNCNENGVPLTGTALREAREKGYYVYTDIWIKTEEEETSQVRLSMPGSGALDTWETARNRYGTWSVPAYRYSGGTLSFLDKESQAAIRVGFLSGEGTPSQRFVIYEPNADMRSAPDKPVTSVTDTTNRYVIGYNQNGTNYAEGYYIPTNPIGKNAESKGEVSSFSSNNLIIQKQSAWNQTALLQKLQDGKTGGSAELSAMGRFVSDNAALFGALDANTNMAQIGDNITNISNTVILTLTKNVPQRIRMFVWIEGQDVDCWNDIATGSFIINLELVGQTS